MLGLNRKTGWSIRLSRSLVEASALGIGILMGGKFGIGTVVFALGIGPVVQFSLAHAHRFLPDFRIPPPQRT
jgi:uncharacterized membrane protein YczE